MSDEISLPDNFDEKVQEWFNKYDLNKNGSLDKKEFLGCFRDMIKQLDDSVPEDKIEEIAVEGIQHFDLNSDGILQLSEFSEMMKFLVVGKGLKL
jgi:Ca2+-binding EF-hand superfamily protein